MKFNKLIMFFSALMMFSGILSSCSDDSATDNPLSGVNYISIEEIKNVEISEGETAIIEVKVFASQASSADRVFDLQIITTAPPTANADYPITTANPDYYSVPTSVTIPSGSKEGTFEVSVTATDLGSGKRIVVGIVPKEGFHLATSQTSPDAEGNFDVIYKNLVINAKERCFKNSLLVEIVTDRYGDETTWELYDSAMNLVGSGGPYPQQATNGEYPQSPANFCLDNGNYTFIIYDNPYNDGMDTNGTGQYGNGYYRLSKIVDGEEVEIAKNGTFGAFDEVSFSLP